MHTSPRDPSDSVPPLSADSRPRLRNFAAIVVLAPLAIATIGAAAWPKTPAQAATVEDRAPVAAAVVAAEPVPMPVEATPPPRAAEKDDPEPKTLDDQIERMFGKLRSELWLSDTQMKRIEAVFEGSPVLSQGNPVISKHPISRAECQSIRAEAGLPKSHVDPRCGVPNMVPMYDPSVGETPERAKACVDQFEFPNIPCEYPVVHVRANEAAEICAAMGKRLCDAHEWEGSCAGAVHDPSTEYEWPKPRMEAEFWHNSKREKVWSYGPKKNHKVCGTMSERTPDCPGGGWNKCGSNTYPSGAFPECKSTLGAYDFHGNAAEHMNLPLRPEELRMANGGGVTEMKGSWFVFSIIQAHEDDCRWRAPQWHESRVTNDNSHRNYHLGFRCCMDVEGAETTAE